VCVWSAGVGDRGAGGGVDKTVVKFLKTCENSAFSLRPLPAPCCVCVWSAGVGDRGAGGGVDKIMVKFLNT